MKKQSSRIYKQRQKKNGVKTNELTRMHIRYSFFHDMETTFDQYNVSHKKKESKNKPSSDSFYDKLVISDDNHMFIAWRMLHTFSCLTSCYFYAFIAAFGVP